MFDRVPWADLKARLEREWKQGQHVTIIAPTGRGKTYLTRELLPMRSHVVFFGTKVQDEEYDKLQAAQRFRRIYRWPPPYRHMDKVMLWPSIHGIKTIREYKLRQQLVFSDALNKIFRSGKWTVSLDELHWIAHDLRLYDEIASLHHQGRSSGLTLIDGFQRPAFVPVIVYSSATHVFSWGTNHREDLKRLSSVAKLDALSARELASTMGSLDLHEFVYVNTRDRKPPVISQVRI